MNSSNKVWAKLVAVQPGNENIILSTDRTEHKFNEEKWKIYQNQDGNILMKNISASFLYVDDTFLEINQEKKLTGGERICLTLQKDNQTEPKIDYVFCLENLKADLKRNRDDTITEPENLQKLVKVVNEFQKELVCSICTNLLQKCMILSPCQHTFCSSCLFHHLKSSNKCPLCRVKSGAVAKKTLLSNLVQLTADSFPTLQRSQEVKELEDITFGGTITMNEEGTYIGSRANSQKDGQGKMIYKNGGIYEGSWKNDEKQGNGIMIFADGDKYDGSWMNGQKHGTGKYIWKNGREYEGDYQNDLKTGYGTVKEKDGRIFQGHYKNGKREGKGIFINSNGDKYEGKWVKGIFQSEVKVEYSNGERYEGEINTKSFKKQGKGTQILENEARCRGIWTDDVLQPQVTIEYTNGEVYVGEIEVKNFKKHGKGALTFKNGGQYDGDWVNDQQHGNGKEIYRDGKRIFEGVWKGRMNGEVIMTDIDGVRYQAEWKRLEVEN